MDSSYEDKFYQLIDLKRQEQPTVEPHFEAGAPGAAVQAIDFIGVHISLLRQRFKLLVSLTVLGLVVAVTIAMFMPMYYRSNLSLELGGMNDMYLGIRDLNSGATETLTDSYMQTQARVISSETVVRRALKAMSTAKPSQPDRPTSGFSVGALLQKTGLKYFTPVISDSSDVGRVTQNLVVRPIPLTRVIDVTYDDTNPFFAADFANTLAKEYIAVNIERRLEDTESTETWLNAYVSGLEKELERAGRNLETYAHDSGLVGTSEKDTPAEARLRDLQEELSKAHAERVSKQALYETASSGSQEGISASINPSPMREYQAKLSDLRSQLAQSSATLTPAHYKVQQLQAQIDEIKALVEKEWEKTLALIRSDYRTALLREKLVVESVQSQTMLVADQAGKRVHYDVLRRALETNQGVYNSMLQKAKESGVLSATKPTNIHILDQAHPAPLPYTPSLPIYASVGGLSGLFASLVLAAYFQRRDDSLMVPGMLAGTRFRELGVIPSAKIDSGTIDRPLHARLLRPSSLSGSGESGSGPQCEYGLVRGQSGLFMEAFHATVASILRSDCNGTQPSVITVTSAVAGDGKTTTVRNLGLALASIHRRVVLIEGDLRYPRLSKSFYLVNSWGLTDILRSTNSLDDMPFEALAQPAGKGGLFVVPSGPSVVDVSTLLHSPRMKALLGTLKRHADIILIDSPPLLAVSDARILGSCSDAVILVIRAHETNRETFTAAARQLIDDRTPILGTVLNDWDPRRGGKDPFQHQYAYRDYHRNDNR
jgi:polysaccharide biosynthesis transport protein